jgi:hypothetical protein
MAPYPCPAKKLNVYMLTWNYTLKTSGLYITNIGGCVHSIMQRPGVILLKTLEVIKSPL